jgi:hypothetical protein
MDIDEGPGSTTVSPGLIGFIYRQIAMRCRGQVWITDEMRTEPGSECNYISFAYFPADGRICLLNADFDRPRRFCLHNGDSETVVELAPAEFRLLDAGLRQTAEAGVDRKR